MIKVNRSILSVAVMSAFALSAAGQDTPLLVSGNTCTAGASARATNSLLPPVTNQQNNSGALYAAATATATNSGSFADSSSVADLQTNTYDHQSKTSFGAYGSADSASPNYPATLGDHRAGVNARIVHTTQFGYGTPPSGLTGVLANADVAITSTTTSATSGTGTGAARVVGTFTGAGLFAINLDNRFGFTPVLTGWFYNEGVGVTNVNSAATGISFQATLLIGWGSTIAFNNQIATGATASATAGGLPGGHADHVAEEVGTIVIQGLNQF